MTTHIHVSKQGRDSNSGSVNAPLLTISAAAELAQPGDCITVHAGIYREAIDPPRGGTSENQRITYQAAEGEAVEIRGSEIVTGWQASDGGLWQLKLENHVFGDFNPFDDLIHGDWFNDKERSHHSGCVYLDGLNLVEAAALDQIDTLQWFAQVDAATTTIRAHFGTANPNEKLTEINVRQTVFYPRATGINYLTVRGFKLRHAATPWAPPTAEQIGLIGTHWSKGWIIEDNEITHSRCVGITLGKYGDAFDNTSANSAGGYVETIERALQCGWNRETIGSHIIRNNTVAHCDQAGIVGSLGAIFSEITGNTIHDIHLQQDFTGAEQAGLKLHAPIDTLIAENHIYRCNRGIWMDWMTQGTRITRNICHDNETEQDLFLEVNHGPFVVDHNLFLSTTSLWNWSQGGAYISNLFGGTIECKAELSRETPYHPAHSTELAGTPCITGGDDRFYNNLLVDRDSFEEATAPTRVARINDLEQRDTDDTPVNPVLHAGNDFLKERPAYSCIDGVFKLSRQPEFPPPGTAVAIDLESLGHTLVSKQPFSSVPGLKRYPI